MKTALVQAVKNISFRPKSVDLNRRLNRMAMLERRGVSQMALILVEDGLADRERTLGLPPVSQDEKHLKTVGQ